MATFIALHTFTEKGVSGIKESPSRAASFRKAVESAGGSVRDIFWTVGRYDGMVVFSVPDETSATALLLSLGTKGNVRTQSLRAFDEREFSEVLKKVK